jgi:hypothetical protein
MLADGVGGGLECWADSVEVEQPGVGDQDIDFGDAVL